MHRPPIDIETNNPEIQEVIEEKLFDAQIPGFKAQFEPQEAEMLGAFAEDALNAKDALESVIDILGADHENT
ncbi:conjugal transfer protein TraD [Nitrosomonas sp. JL21]|uniref:conjugal transfer protein TraD n=1 Tax=Nitrosomonas sp. JL21 TaxID=153949 RepID=UPI00136F786A|nr:conjugal transfer protein TraD [Nitrosomonas sp. JL21]MXS78389.1 conjugal transfer protein TraD [Nitrosomonas sp. JL21]